MILSVVIAGIFLFSTAFAFEANFSYSRQDEWPDICVTGNTGRQSPINIITEDVETDENLIELEMRGWETAYDGAFLNPTGLNVRFVPDIPGQVTIRNHLGTYTLLNVHFHWGTRTGEGSGHQMNSDPGELEVHFVHRKQDEDEMMVGDYLSVIAVIADVDEDAELTGPWQQLDASQVLLPNTSIDVTGFRFDQLLPSNREYYFYEGSFTSPPCYEIVGWFVMKNRITIPGAYLEQLRRAECGGELLGSNFRNPQPLSDRIVKTVGTSRAFFVEPFVPILVLCLGMFKLV